MKPRGWQVLIVIGGFLAVAGLYGVVSSFMVRDMGTTPLPSGAQHAIAIGFNVWGSGSLRVDYEVSRGTVDVFVLTEAQFARYVQTGSAEALLAVGDSAGGSFDAPLPGSGKYVVAIDHGWAYEDVVQEVRTTIRLLGIDPRWLFGGLGFVTLGGILIALGSVGKRKAMRLRMAAGTPGPAMASPFDVTFFPTGSPPEPPAPPSPPST